MNIPISSIWQALPLPAAVLAVWLPALNLMTLFLFWLDKSRARHRKSRIPERTLFLLSILGGSLGALAGMQLWSHKTRHNSFRIGIPAILLLQAAAALWLLTGTPTLS